MSKIKCSMSKFDNANKKSSLFSTSMFSKLNYYGPAAACFYTGPLELVGQITPSDFGRYINPISIRGRQITPQMVMPMLCSYVLPIRIFFHCISTTILRNLIRLLRRNTYKISKPCSVN